MVHTIGDSHAGGQPGLNNAFDKISGITPHWLGPRLMYSISKEGIDLKALNILEGDTIILCFGEIDCRCHVHKFADQQRYQEIIDELVQSYFNLIQNLIHDLNVRVCVFNILPSIKKGSVEENRDFPFLGTDEERKSYVNYMNLRLKENCEINKILFIDIYDRYKTDDGFLKKELSDNSVHIANPIFLEDFLKKNNVIQ